MTRVDTERFDAVILDLDGVITQTAVVHTRAWKRMFDAFLERRRARSHDPGESLAPFDEDFDYLTYVDGKPRYDGVRSFLESRGIHLPYGETTDGPDEETICGLGNRKNEFFHELLRQGVEVFPDALAQIREWRALGLKTAVVSSSRNCALIVEAAGIEALFDARVDGRDGERLGLRGKPDPDLFLEGARRLGVDPRRALVAEDAVAGVEAGRNGGFGLVVGVARHGNESALREAGADVVVTNLHELASDAAGDRAGNDRAGNDRAGNDDGVLPSALAEWGELAQRLAGRRPAVFLDYDGTLTPIVKRPEMATLSTEMRAVLGHLASRAPVAIVSGRDRADVQGLVQLDDLIFAGSHGFDIAGPKGLHLEHDGGAAAGPDLDAARSELDELLGAIPGIFIERKRFAIAVHYRNVADREARRVEPAVDAVLTRHTGRLKKSHGKKVFELRPAIDWDKGKAVLWLLEALDLDSPDVLPIYIGDDLTDEDAFRVLEERGLGILVGDYAPESPTGEIAPTTRASFGLNDTGEVREFLERLAETTAGGGQRSMSVWKLVYNIWDPEKEPLREALCTLGNGYFATRGAAEEASAGGPHYPATYLAGGYSRLKSEIAGRVIENEDLVNWPNWLYLTFRHEGGEWLNLDKVEILDYWKELDLRRGVLKRKVRFRDTKGRVTALHSQRLVHMSDPHMAAIEWKIVPENWSGRIEIRSGLDGTVTNSGVARYRDLDGKHLKLLATGAEGEVIDLLVESRQSRIQMAMAARTQVQLEGGGPASVRRRVTDDSGFVAHELTLDVEAGTPLRVEKVISLFTSRDHAISEPRYQAGREVERAPDFARLLESHVRAWSRVWHRCDIELDGSEYAQRVLRLHIFHLMQTVSKNTIDLDVGAPARGLHGEAYRGHIFWDELFIFPFLNLRIPEITRELLMYRYRRLPEALAAARAAGYEGAMYPWQSGSDGREESQVVHLNPRSGRWHPDHSHLQRHINAVIAYNVWQYYEATRDVEFISFFGAEMVLELARFWASATTYNEERNRYEIHGVMGPDEYHDGYPDSEQPGLNNNAYTNLMAAWVLCCSTRVLDLLPEDRQSELLQKCGIAPEEIQRWKVAAEKMFIPFHDGNIISQFEGYEKLAELDWDAYKRKYGDIHRLDRILAAENDTPNRYRLGKQADVLMLFYLFSAEELQGMFQRLGYSFDPQDIPANIDYYLQRTSHGSTLSGLVHSWVLSRSDRQRSWEYFESALRSDVDDVQGGTTPEGIHLGAMAGTIDLVQRCYTGIEVRDDVLWLNPCLPEQLNEVRFRIRYRGHWLGLHVNHDRMTIAFEDGGARAKIGFAGQVHIFDKGEVKVFQLPHAQP